MEENELQLNPQESKLKSETDEVIKNIVDTQDPSTLKDLTNLFNMCMTKKNILRAETLNDLVDHSTQEMLVRIKHHPGEFSHADLISYVNVAQASLDRITKSSEAVENAAIVFNQNNTQINVQTDTGISEETRQNVVDAMSKLLLRLHKEELNASMEISEESPAQEDSSIENDQPKKED